MRAWFLHRYQNTLLLMPWLMYRLHFPWFDGWKNGECRACGLARLPGDVTRGGDLADPCLGVLPGVSFACCGHGNRRLAYAAFTDGSCIRGFDVIDSRAPLPK